MLFTIVFQFKLPSIKSSTRGHLLADIGLVSDPWSAPAPTKIVTNPEIKEGIFLRHENCVQFVPKNDIRAGHAGRCPFLDAVQFHSDSAKIGQDCTRPISIIIFILVLGFSVLRTGIFLPSSH
ncbi:unnamed protein product [Callosobruchus maculatus]|uniref:Uncharacterized protein n=1 Tax=Callosobruchus maculatus TaxID=64391 RepID=A0A653CQZ2_CALMS|nr:unnamed protein product [Callosobruchus maculatus]